MDINYLKIDNGTFIISNEIKWEVWKNNKCYLRLGDKPLSDPESIWRYISDEEYNEIVSGNLETLESCIRELIRLRQSQVKSFLDLF